MIQPDISCVIPAFENPALLERCLRSVLAQRNVSMEVIVSDDSASPQVADVVRAVSDSAAPVRYLAGPRSGNPVENWNAGLAAARAPLHLLIHHDEHLLDPGYLGMAVDALQRTGAGAAMAGTRVTAVDRPSRFALVSPIASRVWGRRHLLPALNWIGPTAAFTFRAGHRFDPTLVQLVDVEFYARVLQTGALVRLPGVSVGSLGHHGAQITARIDPKALAREELDRLAARRPAGVTPWARALCSALIALRSGTASPSP
jgi:glycosyltransferase involved in cell wall biosynthesis